MKNELLSMSQNPMLMPREKLIHIGANALSDAELLAILVGTGTQITTKTGEKISKTALDLSNELLAKTSNSLVLFFKQDYKSLMQVTGIGEAKALTIVAAIELCKRRKIEENVQTINKFNNSKTVYDFILPHIQNLEVEHFFCLYLNQANSLIAIERISEGGINSVTVDVPMIIKKAILHNSKCIIAIHNHPSGNFEPSKLDKILTSKLFEASKILDIALLDHVIATNYGYYSFKDNGQLP